MADELTSATDRLLNQISHWTPARWAAGQPYSNAVIVHQLVQELADLGAEANGEERRQVPRLDNDLALPDQLRVMVHELVAAKAGPPSLYRAIEAINKTSGLLS